MHGIHDGGPEACEACGGTMRKVLSPPAIHFKGSGWAKKDAASTASKAKPTAGSAAATSDAGAGDEAKAGAKDKDTSSGKDSAVATSTDAKAG